MTTIQGIQAKAPMFGQADAGKKINAPKNAESGKKVGDLKAVKLDETQDEAIFRPADKTEPRTGFLGRAALLLGGLVTLVILAVAYAKGKKLGQDGSGMGLLDTIRAEFHHARNAGFDQQRAVHRQNVRQAPQELIDNVFGEMMQVNRVELKP